MDGWIADFFYTFFCLSVGWLVGWLFIWYEESVVWHKHNSSHVDGYTFSFFIQKWSVYAFCVLWYAYIVYFLWVYNHILFRMYRECTVSTYYTFYRILNSMLRLKMSFITPRKTLLHEDYHFGNVSSTLVLVVINF